MLCCCKSRVLLPGAICFPAAVCLGTLGAPSLAMRLFHHFNLPFVQASAALPMGFHVAVGSHLVWSPFSASHDNTTSGAFLARVLCWQMALPEQKGQPVPWVLRQTATSQMCERPSGH